MPYAELNGASIFYTDEGEGAPVLLVHGWSCDGNDWSWQLPALRAAGYRCIVPDLRGHGRSSAPEDGYTPRAYADDLAALIRQLGTGPIVAVGHSMGGATVVALAVEHAGLVRGIVPVDSGYGMTGTRADVQPVIEGLKGEDGVAVARQIFSGYYGPDASPAIKEIHMRRVAALAPHVRWKAIAGMFDAPDQFCLPPASDAYLRRVAAPALAFRAGKQDPATVAAWEHARFQHPKSKAVAWEGTGHWLHQERPAEFNAILLDWLATLD